MDKIDSIAKEEALASEMASESQSYVAACIKRGIIRSMLEINIKDIEKLQHVLLAQWTE